MMMLPFSLEEPEPSIVKIVEMRGGQREGGPPVGCMVQVYHVGTPVGGRYLVTDGRAVLAKQNVPPAGESRYRIERIDHGPFSVECVELAVARAREVEAELREWADVEAARLPGASDAGAN